MRFGPLLGYESAEPMPPALADATALRLMQALTALFLAILFLQSGLDKVVDRRGNREYFNDHFARSPFRGQVVPLLAVLTAIELTAGILCGLGVLQIVFQGSAVLAFWGAAVSAAAIVCLFFGQRVAKDYQGAAVLVPYFLLTLVALFLTR